MRKGFLIWLFFSFALSALVFRDVLADEPGQDRITEILSAQKSALSTARIYNPESSGTQTRSPAGPQLYQQTVGGTVLVITESSLGSGVRVAQQFIVTNWHVVGEKKYAAILFWRPNVTDLTTLTDKDLVPALVLGTDSRRDLALLLVDPKKVPPYATIIKSASLSEVFVGQDVFAIGHPEGLFWSYTEGVVSQIRRNFSWVSSSSKHRASVIQTQTPISFGSSGGPLFDQKGRLIGLNTGSRAPGLNISVAVDEVTNFTFEIISRLNK